MLSGLLTRVNAVDSMRSLSLRGCIVVIIGLSVVSSYGICFHEVISRYRFTVPRVLVMMVVLAEDHYSPVFGKYHFHRQYHYHSTISSIVMRSQLHTV